mmetsp:Transcript_56141/g.93571  ORF Transcript_56141/g.93571 Transcript_56141/m.93571 type:complete len:288 (+) Transcript_56141:430-1293(+)
MKRSKFTVGDQEPCWLRLIHHDTRITGIICSDADKIAVHAAGRRLNKMIANCVSKREGVEHVFPVGATKHKRATKHCLFIHIVDVVAEPRIEMHILDATNIIHLVDKHANPNGLTLHTSYIMSWRRRSENANITVQQLNILHCGIVAIQSNRWRIRHGNVTRTRLFWIENDDAFDGCIGGHRNKRQRLILLCATVIWHEHCAIRWLRRACMRWYRQIRAKQSDTRRNTQLSIKHIIAARRKHNTTTVIGSALQRRLKCFGVIGCAITHRTKRKHVEGHISVQVVVWV